MLCFDNHQEYAVSDHAWQHLQYLGQHSWVILAAEWSNLELVSGKYIFRHLQVP